MVFEPAANGAFVARAAMFEASISPRGVRLHPDLRIHFAGGNAAARLEPLSRQASETHYYIGDDPRQWKRRVANYGLLRAANVYPGIDAEFHGDRGELEYDFVVHPGSDPGLVRVRLEGAASVRLGKGGEVIAEMPQGRFVQAAPLAYQIDGAQRRAVRATNRLRRSGPASWDVTFRLGAYDRSRTLVIDPPVTYAVLVGNNGGLINGSPAREDLDGIAVDRSNQAVIVGSTLNNFFPAPSGAVRSQGQDCVIVKLNAAGTAILATILLGGQGSDACRAVTLDNNNNIYVTGETSSEDFPRLSQFQTQLKGETDGFVAKFSPNGAQMFFSSYLGGSQIDEPRAIAVDSAGAPYIAGRTLSADFPTLNALNAFPAGALDGFVTKLDPSGSSIVYSTFLGGARFDSANAIAVDSAGAAYVGGATGGAGFPVQSALQTNYTGTITAGFVTKLRPGGASIEYSTYLGGESLPGNGCCADTTVNAIAVDSANQAHVVGDTNSAEFPVTANASRRVPAGRDAFYLRLSAAGNTAVYSTLIGGGLLDRASGIALDSTGVYISGATQSPDFPVADPFIARAAQSSSFTDGFVMKLAPAGTSILYSSFLGGASGSVRLAVDSSGAAYVGASANKAAQILPAVRALGDPLNGMLVVKVGVGGSSPGGGGGVTTPDPGASTCIRAFFPATVLVGQAAASVQFVVDALDTCSWSMRSNVPWATPDRTSGVGSFVIALAVQANTGAAARTGTITAGGLVLTINQAGPATTAQPLIRTVVGSAIRESYTPDGVALARVEVVRPGQVAIGIDGTIYVPEPSTHRIRTVSPANVWGTIAGNSDTGGFAGDGGPSKNARLGSPGAVETDVSGNLYIADTSNRRVRIVNDAGVISTIAGGGMSSEDGTAAAEFSLPFGVNRIRRDWQGGMFVLTSGPALFYVDRDRKVKKIFEGLAYRDTPFRIVSGLGVDGRGNLYIADDRANRVYRIDAAGEISVFAGNGAAATRGDGGPALDASINAPIDVVADVAGNVYIAERSGYRIRRVSPDGTIQTVAGTGVANLSDAADGIPATEARLGSVNSLSIDLYGDLYITEASRIRKVAFNQPARHRILFASGHQAAARGIVAPSSFVAVLGSLFTPQDQQLTWDDAVAAGGALPVELGGVRMFVNGKPVYLSEASFNWVVGVSPAETMRGAVPVHVLTPSGMAWTIAKIEDLTPAVAVDVPIPELKNWAKIRLSEDLSVVTGRPGDDSSGPLRAGQAVQLFAFGLGMTDPQFPQGEVLTQAYPLASLEGLTVLFGDAPATIKGAAMTSAGQYRIELEAPAGLEAGDYLVTIQLPGNLRTGGEIWVRYAP